MLSQETKAYILQKQAIPDLIKHLLRKYVLWGPVREENIVLYRQINSPQQITLDFQKVCIPPKKIVFPQTETLMRFCKEKDMTVEVPPFPKKPVVLFGIRPCDVKSFHVFDTVFLRDCEDPYYASKRRTMISVGLTCSAPPQNCFCSSVGGNPDDPTGFDVLMTELTDAYYTEILTERGEELLKGFNGCTPASKQDLEKKNEVCNRAQKNIKRQISVQNTETILDTIFDSSYWETIAERCIGCGICTFLCPTCYCFDIQDETAQNKGARVRIWDSCMYQEYSCQASGYNPRAMQMNRIRNRIYHKFNYLPKNNQVLGCVGCGRCIDMCPVHIDIVEIIAHAREVTQ